MKCANCGSDAPDWAASCPNCGAVMAGAASPPYGGQGAPQGWADPAGAPAPVGGWPRPGGSGPWAPAAGYGGAPIGGRLAGWWLRVGATLVDGIIVGVVSTALAYGLGTGGRVLGVVLGIVYQVALTGAARGQTVGNMAVGTRVVDEQTGRGIGYPRALVRYVVEGLLFIVLFVPGVVDLLWPLWDGRNQTLHDKAARSLVVYTS
ncbi:MAG: RDD family protein [Acidimicrobiales bacterium]